MVLLCLRTHSCAIITPNHLDKGSWDHEELTSRDPKLLSVLTKEKTMKTPRYFILAFATVLLAAQIAYVSPANAQTSVQTEQDRLSRVMDPSTSVDDFRKEYDNYLADMESDMRLLSSARILPDKNRQVVLDSIQQIGAARRGIASMSSDDWVKAREIYAKFPGWRNSLLSPAMRSRIESAQALKGGQGPEPNEITPDTCPNEADVASNTDISVEKLAIIPLQGAADAIPEELVPLKIAAIAAASIEEAILVGYETGRTIHLECISATKADIQSIVDLSRSKLIFDLPNYIVGPVINNDNTNRDTILAALTTNGTNVTAAVTSAKTEIVNNNNAQTTALSTAISNSTTSIVNNSNSNTSTLNTNINTTRSAIIDNNTTNTANIVNNDNTNRSLIINNSNANAAALSDMILRTQIEADLAEADNATYVAWYVMPTAMGGHFDFARAIVVDTITKLAGSNAAKANAFLAQSDAAKSAGDFKTAYQYLRKAYKAALN